MKGVHSAHSIPQCIRTWSIAKSPKSHSNWLKQRGNVLTLTWEWCGFQAQLDHGSSDAPSVYLDSRVLSICGPSPFHGHSLSAEPSSSRGETNSNTSIVTASAPVSVPCMQGVET